VIALALALTLAAAGDTAGLIPPATAVAMSQPAPITVESDPTPITPELEQVTTPAALAPVDVQPEPDQAGAGTPQPAPAPDLEVVLIDATSTIPTTTFTIPVATSTTAPWAGEAGNAGPTPIVEQRTLDALWAIGAAAAAAVLGIGGHHCRRAAQA
jgi:hypothetical protein